MIQLVLRLSALSFVVALGAGDAAIVQHDPSVVHGIAMAGAFDLLMLLGAAAVLALFGEGSDV